jgi:hypothetical protein
VFEGNVWGLEWHNSDISPNGVRGIWLRQNMNTTALRVKKAQAWQKSA